MGKRRHKQPRLQDLYEAEEADAEEEKEAGRRYDVVDNFQYELPAEFEDEEIDEDAAFTEEDKKMYAHMFKEDASGSEDGDAGSPAELTRDDFSDDDSEADRAYGSSDKMRVSTSKSAEGSGDSDVDDIFAGVSDDDGSEEAEQDLEEAPEDSAELEKVSKAVRDVLGGRKKKGPAVEPDLVDEAVPESEHNVSLGPGDTGQLSIGDLVRALGPQEGKLSKAQKQLAQLVRKPEAVAPPLPGPIRARKERQAGYAATKKDVSKWVPLVRANREAPTIVFTAATNDVPRTSTTAALLGKFKAEGGMEAEVAELLRAAGMSSETAIEEAEEALALKAVSAEEVAERRNELAKMRSLMFKHEEKARHLAKIKSKDYHRRTAKAARHKAEKAGEMNDSDFIRLEAEKAEFERAKERLTLKHKNSSQWARRALKRGVNLHNDDGTKEAIAEQLRLGEELRRRVNRMDPVEGSDTDATDTTDSESEVSEAEGGREGQKMGRRAASKAKAAATAILEDAGEEEEGEVSKSLFSLPFMKRAQERRKAAAQDQAQKLLEELEGTTRDDAEGSGPGRLNFGLAGGVQAAPAPDLSEGDDSGSDMNEDAEAKADRLRSAAGNVGNPLQKSASASPKDVRLKQWPEKQKRKKQKIGSLVKPGEKAGFEVPTEGRGLSSAESSHPEDEDGPLDVLKRVSRQQGSTDAWARLLSNAEPSSVKKLLATGKKQPSVTIGPGKKLGEPEADEDASEEEEADQPVQAEKKRRSVAIVGPAVIDSNENTTEEAPQTKGDMSQRELIAQAFAGDDVAAEFAAGKDAEVEAEVPAVDAPSQLPGWGMWATQQREPAWMVAARAKAEQLKQAAKAGRKDANLKGVVISERWDKKSAKYTAASLPFPFASAAAFEGSMRHPLGADYNTESSFRALTRPAVIKSSGVIIQPLKFSAALAESKQAVTSTNQYHRQSVQRVSGGMAHAMKKRKVK